MLKYKILPDTVSDTRIKYTSRILAQNMAKRKSGYTPRCHVVTFGCQQNVADSEKLMGMCISMGYEPCDNPEDADIILANTCAVREHAEKKALSTIGQFKHIKAKRPELIIGVCGCMVTQEHRKNDIKFRYPYVDFVFGTSSIHRLPELICERQDKQKRIYCPEEAEYLVAEGLPINRESTYRAWVSIMYGCNNFCTYCIVPYVRGRERSRRPEDIIAEVRDLVSRGYRDITLLGQNVNSYGKDAVGEAGESYDFADLLSDLDKIEGDYYLRFMTSHPKDASKKLIDVMAASKHIAHQFHLPMQSGSDRILKKMNRHYDREKYLSTVDYLYEKIPDVTITSDIIVGFPGECEEDFLGTLEMLERVRFDMTYSFIFSPRVGTPAAEMEDSATDKEKGERFNRLLDTQNKIGYEKNQALVGKTVRVLCDGRSKNNPDVFCGRDEGNKIVLFDGCDADTGNFVTLRIVRADTFALYGEK